MKKVQTIKKKTWPWGKPLPSFKNESEEISFWHTHEFEPPPEDIGEDLVYEPQATRHPRNHVYRIRLDDKEMALLQRLAKLRGTPASVVLRMLIKEKAGGK